MSDDLKLSVVCTTVTRRAVQLSLSAGNSSQSSAADQCSVSGPVEEQRSGSRHL